MKPVKWHQEFIIAQKSLKKISGQIYLRLYDENEKGQTVSGTLILGGKGRFRLELYDPIGGLIALYIGNASSLAFFDARKEMWVIGNWNRWKDLNHPFSQFMSPGLIHLLVGQLASVSVDEIFSEKPGVSDSVPIQACGPMLEKESIRWTRAKLKPWISSDKFYRLAWRAGNPQKPGALQWERWLVCWKNWTDSEMGRIPQEIRVFKTHSQDSRRPPKVLALFWDEIQWNPQLKASLFQWKKSLEELRYPVRILR